jgi:hypothetical protein
VRRSDTRATVSHSAAEALIGRIARDHAVFQRQRLVVDV